MPGFGNDGEDDINHSDDENFNTPAGSVDENDNNSLGNIDEAQDIPF